MHCHNFALSCGCVVKLLLYYMLSNIVKCVVLPCSIVMLLHVAMLHCLYCYIVCVVTLLHCHIVALSPSCSAVLLRALSHCLCCQSLSHDMMSSSTVSVVTLSHCYDVTFYHCHLAMMLHCKEMHSCHPSLLYSKSSGLKGLVKFKKNLHEFLDETQGRWC